MGIFCLKICRTRRQRGTSRGTHAAAAGGTRDKVFDRLTRGIVKQGDVCRACMCECVCVRYLISLVARNIIALPISGESE